MSDSAEEHVVERRDISVSLEYASSEFARAAASDGIVKSSIVFVANVLAARLPDINWMLAISENMARSILDRHPAQDADGEDTLERGSNVVAARTLRNGDGSFDFLVSSTMFLIYRWADQTQPIPQDEIDRVWAVLEHTAVHESCQANLEVHGEDAPAYQDTITLPPTQFAYRAMLAITLDECRAERVANCAARVRPTRSTTFGDDLTHFRIELNESLPMVASNFMGALTRTMTAVSELVKALAYLAAELEPNADGQAPRPQPVPDGWDEYVEQSWDAFYAIFRDAPDADTRATVDELAATLSMLCQFVSAWLETIGVRYAMYDDHSQSCYWLRSSY
jgi:hypothetical protein